jgi:hypothetical protein
MLAIFLFYPMIMERGGIKAARLTSVFLAALWLFTLVSGFMILAGTATPSYSFEAFDVYSTTFGPMPYLGILSIPISIALIDALVIAQIYAREKEPFFKTRSLLLLVGWLLTLFAQVALLSTMTLLLNPVLSVIGMLLMSLTVLRRKPP